MTREETTTDALYAFVDATEELLKHGLCEDVAYGFGRAYVQACEALSLRPRIPSGKQIPGNEKS